MSVQDGALSPKRDLEKPCEESLPATLELLGGFSVAGMDSLAASDTGGTANLASPEWFNRRNTLSGDFGAPTAQPYPDRTRFRFGGGRMSEFRFAADVPGGITGGRGKFTAFLLEAEIPQPCCEKVRWNRWDGSRVYLEILRLWADWGSESSRA